MGKQVTGLSRGDGLGPTAMSLLHKPLEFIHEDHLREREICARMDQIAQGSTVSASAINDVIHFLTRELPVHLMDEEQDLFPLLRRRCLPEDDIGKIIARLFRDHGHANEDTPGIVKLLEGLVETPRTLEDAESGALATYASHARRHLILENAIILPFARLRLTGADLEILCIRMCQRRGINHLQESDDAEGSS